MTDTWTISLLPAEGAKLQPFPPKSSHSAAGYQPGEATAAPLSITSSPDERPQGFSWSGFTENQVSHGSWRNSRSPSSSSPSYNCCVVESHYQRWKHPRSGVKCLRINSWSCTFMLSDVTGGLLGLKRAFGGEKKEKSFCLIECCSRCLCVFSDLTQRYLQ